MFELAAYFLPTGLQCLLPQLTEFGLAVEKRKRGPTYVDVMSSVYIGLVCEVLALSIVESAN